MKRFSRAFILAPIMKEKWQQVFKTGTHTDSSGNTRTWTREDLDKIVSLYAERGGEDRAPAVIGHPRSDSPAYGWAMELKRDGDLLFAKIKPTVKEFVGWVNKKMYNKISIALRPDLSLRHIGFLGAAAPAVKGLKAPEFAEGEFMEMEIDMSEIQNKEGSEMDELEKLKAELKRKEAEFEELKKEKKALEEKGAGRDSKFKELETKFAASEEERAQAKKELRRLSLNGKKMEFEQFLNREVAWASLNDDQKKTAFKILEFLRGEEFAESGEDSEGEKLFKEFLKSLPERVKSGEFATQQRAAGNAAEGKAAEFEEKVTEHMKANEGMEYAEAVIAVAEKHPALYEAASNS